jgi:acetyltransferase
MDKHFDPEHDSMVKLLYIENIADPDKLLYHATSLIRKGCRIAAIKAGSSESGSRAASSHTGALASSDSAVEALFRKAGIVRCFSREELTTVGCIFKITENGKLRTERYDHLHPQVNETHNGQTNHTSQFSPLSSPLRIAIITHAGGPGVMLTDALSKGGMQVPPMTGALAEELKSKLLPGSSVANPIDILATGTAEHLGIAIDYCEKMDDIDAIMVIFGTPGLVKIFEVYDVLDKKIRECRKPIFPILPSVSTAGAEVQEFLKRGHVNFCDEVTLATALTQILKTPEPAPFEVELYGTDIPRLHTLIGGIKEDGYLAPDLVRQILSCAGIPLVPELVSTSKDELSAFAEKVGFPVVAKVVGPVHKSDVGGVSLNIRSKEVLAAEFDRMMQIPGATAVMVQKMIRGMELFIGAKYEERFGHVILCGLGGIFVEVLKDVSSGLAPLSYDEAFSMIHSLRGYKILKGTRGQKGINEQKYAEIIVRLSTLLRFATEIKEMDLNPLLADDNDVVAVDARILIEREG